ncbi:hypothetical protein K1719_023999 [Acacia pycnantha]|nr:hypothetical protein K1719_023999 [Acacia pycnantha]
MAPLLEMFPNLQTKETLAPEEELAPFKNYSSRMAAIDYTVCLHSEVFVTTQEVDCMLLCLGCFWIRCKIKPRIDEDAFRIDDPEGSAYDYPMLESGPARFHDGCSRLRSRAYSSLNLYKHELLRVLYPVFIHCFMDLVAKRHIQEARNFFNTFREDHDMLHLRDLQKLEGNGFAHSLRQSKFNIKICDYSYELPLQHLHNTQSATILGLINEHIDFQGTSLQVKFIHSGELVNIAGVAHFPPLCSYFWTMEAARMQQIRHGEAKEGENEENKKRSIEGGKQSASIKKVKKDKGGSASGKSAKPETIPAAPRVKPELPLPIIYVNVLVFLHKKSVKYKLEVELSILEDLRNRVQLSSVALPSVSFYTFLNTRNV